MRQVRHVEMLGNLDRSIDQPFTVHRIDGGLDGVDADAGVWIPVVVALRDKIGIDEFGW